jgi:hypothetical protein
VIHKTFQPLAGPGRDLPKDLAPKLLHRFTSDEGYTLTPGVIPLLRSLKQHQKQTDSLRIAVGVITNSDDRVPSILSSLGLRVSPARFGTPFDPAELAAQQYDVDLHCMSYDVGFAKPDRRIFDAAENMAYQLAAAQDAASHGRRGNRAVPWLKVYVGDEYENDVVGARGAAWNPVFVGTEEGLSGKEVFSDLGKLGNTALDEVFSQNSGPVTIRAESTQIVLEWLTQQYAR